MNDHLTWALERAREHTLTLVRDVPADSMHHQSVAGERHPAWLLGHLLLADTYLLSLLTGEAPPPEFPVLLRHYGPKSSPTATSPAHSKEFLVDHLGLTNGRRLARVGAMSDADLARPLRDTYLARAQPTIGHHLYNLVFHEGYHGGQISAWRKAHGFGPVRWTFGPAA